MNKKNLLAVFIFLFSFAAKAQDVSLSLGPFRDYLISSYPSCFVNTDIDGNLMLSTNCAAIQAVTTMNLNLGFSVEPVDLEGLEYFTSLRNLSISSTPVVNFVYPASVDSFYCLGCVADAPFGSLPVPPNTKYLVCSGNDIATVSFPGSLLYIDCSNNCISSLPALPANLETLKCSLQRGVAPYTAILTSLPSLPASLKYLDCSANAMTSMPGALPSSLLYLDCSSNYINTNPETILYTLTSIPSLPSNLQTLKCFDNCLTSLPTLPASLTYLDCSKNRWFDEDMNPSGSPTLVFEGIDALPPLPAALQYLNCSNNKLTALAPLPAGLNYLNVANNVKISSAQSQTQGIQCLPHIPSGVTFLDASGTLVNCLPNSGSFTPSLPLCTPTNNSNLCVSSPVISGHFFYDNNSNGLQEPGENYRANVEVGNSLGQHAYSNINGYFEISGDIGTISVDPVPPPYYTVAPPTISYTFSTYDTVVSRLYALQPTVSIDSVTVQLIPSYTANPGFSYSYHVAYENVGTTVVAANITLNYDETRLTYNSGSIPGVINNGSTLTLPGINVSPGDRGSAEFYFTVSPTALLGDTLKADIRCVANTDISTDSTYDVIQSAFDPNDKLATPSMSTAEVSAGKYIEYLVRFQNTGTDTAVNVVITDALNALLDVNSFQMLDASHACVVKRTGNNLSFEFRVIMLPDSNVNKITSHGYIRFRVKPVSTILANTVIPNLAQIYFDFNTPVITNTANTTINLAVVPVTLLAFSGYADQAEKSAVLNWKTSTEMNTLSFEIERSIDGRSFEKAGVRNARGAGNNEYGFRVNMIAREEFYRLKIIDIDGHFTYSNVIKVSLGSGSGFALLTSVNSGDLQLTVYDPALQNKQATIIDNRGAVVSRFAVRTGTQFISVRQLPNGVYYLNLQNETDKFTIMR